MKYKLVIATRKYMKVGENWDYVEFKNEFEFDWETLVSFLGCFVDSSISKEITFEIKKIEEA